MAGKRILDLAAIFSATRAIARNHVSQRASQLEIYNSTSSLTQALRRSSIPTIARVTSPPAIDTANESGSTIPQRNTVNSSTSSHTSEQAELGSDQDHHYEAPRRNDASDPLSEEELIITQEASTGVSLADGSAIPRDQAVDLSHHGGDGLSSKVATEPRAEPLARDVEAPSTASTPMYDVFKHQREQTRSAMDEARRLQRNREAKITSVAPRPLETLSTRDVAGGDVSELNQGHNRYERSTVQVDAHPSLPRDKIPTNSQGGDDALDSGSLNANVFLSSRSEDVSMASIQATADLREQEQDIQDFNTDIFHSPRIAKLLTGREKRKSDFAALKLWNISDTPLESASLMEKKNQDPSNGQNIVEVAPMEIAPTQSISLNHELSPVPASEPEQPVQPDEDIRKLAEDITVNLSDNSDPPAEPAPYVLRESRVPSSRIGRLWQYGSLATSMTFGAVGESLRRATGSPSPPGTSIMLSPANMDRLVSKLSRMRGAALKLGQMMSFQDAKLLPPAMHQVLQRVQSSADYMPASQRDAVLASSLGPGYASLFSSFTETPLAAASIGQVHAAVLAATSEPVAVKIQYPGVASSISSDLSNLSLLLTASRLLPAGLYLDKTIANAREELAWECDYEREAACARRFHALLSDDTSVFTVPRIIDAASGPQVLTMQLMHGTPVTKLLPDLPQSKRDWIGTQLLRLCLREITEFRYMQTDPNWTNFLYNQQTSKIELLDFGACREYPESFILPYTRLLQAAARRDRDSARDLSIHLGYLTGLESRSMLDAHLTSLFTLAEPFADPSSPASQPSRLQSPPHPTPRVYDFHNQTITDRVRALVPVMLRERLCPPPEETYSLHRKLSGAFLLCARLGSRVDCRGLFHDALGKAGLE